MVPAAYIHVPFCAHHCGYCDFAVAAGQDHLTDLYLEALAIEMAGAPVPVETIFIGGGTPTHLDITRLERLLKLIRSRFSGPIQEFSIESTPDSISESKLEILANHGVTRISIGVQSFDDATLRALDRRHDSSQARTAIKLVKRANLAASLDLIFGAPGQTLDAWRNDLKLAMELGTDHLSTYGLTYETGTPLWKRRREGAVTPLTEDLELAMYEESIVKLTSNGYEHYEVSNFAKPGHRCKHNEHYWANDSYYGFGVGAARYLNGERAHNLRDTQTYIRKVLAGEDPTQQRETLPPRERALETLAVQLRRRDGIERTAFELKTGFTLSDIAGPAIVELVESQLLNDDGKRISLTHKGLCLADAVIERILRLAKTK